MNYYDDDLTGLDELAGLDGLDGPAAGAGTLEAGRHELHVAHLVLGLAFLGISLMWLLTEVGVLSTTNLGVWIPVPFLLAGGLGLLAVLRRSRRPR